MSIPAKFVTADSVPTKKMAAMQYTEIDVVLRVPAPGQECELCGRKVPKERKAAKRG